jgi:hypothetical protein
MPKQLSNLGLGPLHSLKMLSDACQSLFKMSFWNRNDQIFFGFEILEDRSLMYTGIIGNVSYSRVVKTTRGKDTLRGFYDKLAFSIC